MTAKPSARRAQMASAFQQQSVVDRYEYRPPYPAETFQILGELIRDQPRAVLDVGAGAGDVARPMLAFAERVDAIAIRCASPGSLKRDNWSCALRPTPTTFRWT